ncbi:aldehyde dehydrogenase family protein [Variovorax sp. W2I14]|uniref:aldehyde dehydrogenase family protein n=1 Tax=Variovorax sp. W2I14 TaxID=3042290 RepID=UPI003D24004D
MANLTDLPDSDSLAIAELQALFALQKEAFQRNSYPSAQRRRDDLRRLAQTVLDHRDAINEALALDFGAHPRVAGDLIEVAGVAEGMLAAASRVEKWMRPERRHTDLLQFGTGKAFVAHQPKGVIGNIVPWNFPFHLALSPLGDMLAAGNRVILKPSEYTPHSGALLARMLAKAFDQEQVAVVNGGVPLAQAFTRQRWDHLLYTGSTQVGRLVALAAAENLVPVTLELGGKSPVIFDRDSVTAGNVGHMLAIKLVKNGQMCIAPDYCLVPRADLEKFVAFARAHFEGELAGYSGGEDCTGIISQRHLQRNQRLLDEARRQGTQVIQLDAAGTLDPQTRRMPVSLVVDPPDDLAIMQEEIFGPMLVVKPYDDLDEALSTIKRGERPLALYLFSDQPAVIDRVQRETTSGGFCVNACAVQGMVHSLGFGGVGHSGTGRHHGFDGFREFSNPRGVFVRGRGGVFEVLAPPYGRKANRMAGLALSAARLKARGLWGTIFGP